MDLRSGKRTFEQASAAVTSGQATVVDWSILAECSARLGLDSVVAVLMRYSGSECTAPEWWRWNIQLASDISRMEESQLCEQLAALEESGAGPSFDLDRHATEVSAVMLFLQDYLKRLSSGVAPRTDRACVMHIVRLVRLAAQRLARENHASGVASHSV